MAKTKGQIIDEIKGKQDEVKIEELKVKASIFTQEFRELEQKHGLTFIAVMQRDNATGAIFPELQIKLLPETIEVNKKEEPEE